MFAYAERTANHVLAVVLVLAGLRADEAQVVTEGAFVVIHEALQTGHIYCLELTDVAAVSKNTRSSAILC